MKLVPAQVCARHLNMLKLNPLFHKLSVLFFKLSENKEKYYIFYNIDF